MKKILTFVFPLFMCISLLSINVFAAADTKETTISYTVDEKYTWSVPSSVIFDTNGGTATCLVTVSNCILKQNSNLYINLDSPQEFKITSEEGAERSYTVQKNSSSLSVGGNVLIVPYGENAASATLELILNTVESGDEIAGTYKGTLKFIATIR